VDKDSEKLMTNAEGQKLNQIGINDFNEEEIDAIEKEKEKKKARAKELAQLRKENKKNQPPELPRRSERIKNKVEKIELNFNDPDNNI
jgi:methylmalonyl-CoA mutase N-terminal domain/subunit